MNGAPQSSTYKASETARDRHRTGMRRRNVECHRSSRYAAQVLAITRRYVMLLAPVHTGDASSSVTVSYDGNQRPRQLRDAGVTIGYARHAVTQEETGVTVATMIRVSITRLRNMRARATPDTVIWHYDE